MARRHFPCDHPVDAGELEALENGKIIRLKKPVSLNDHEEGCLPTRNIALVFALARNKMLRFEGVITRTSVTYFNISFNVLKTFT